MHDTPRPSKSPSAPRLAIVAAVAANGVIGAANDLPWRLPGDLKRFRELTLGHALIMGRRTWDSIGRPLPGRQNIVVTRQKEFKAEGADIASSLTVALAAVRLPLPVFCIGGAEIFAEAMPLTDLLHLTEIHQAFDGDVYFPAYDASAWGEISREAVAANESGISYDFVTYARRR